MALASDHWKESFLLTELKSWWKLSAAMAGVSACGVTPMVHESPYELNITYLEAVADSTSVSAAEHSRRFLATQAIMLSMQGMPAIYFHSLVGSPNDQQGVEESGQNRRINRHKYQRSELEAKLADPHGLQRRVFDGYQTLLRIRVEQHAFHPNAKQQVIDLPGNGLLGFHSICRVGRATCRDSQPFR